MLDAHPSRIFAHDEWTKVYFRFDKDVAAGAAQAQGKQVPSGQPAHEWDGLAVAVDPLETTGIYDLHEFDVLPNFDTDSVTVQITWDGGPMIASDLDLYVDRLIDGVWSPIGQSTNGQGQLAGTPVETVVLSAPAVGKYRARVHNWASTQIAYHGSATFFSDGVITKPRKVRIAGGRATVDRPDIAAGSQLHYIYFVPSDGTDNQLDVNGVMDDAIAATSGWFARETGGFHMRVDSYVDNKATRPDITFVRGLRTAGEYAADENGAFTAVTDELEERGWTAYPGTKRYVVYYEGPAEQAGICGTAYLTLGAGYAQWSVVFLGSSPGCGARDFGNPTDGAGVSESIAVQEMLHNEGQTRPEAPHHCIGLLNQFHICTAAFGSQLNRVQQGLDPESVDALFPYVTFALRDKHLDKGREDYYNHPFLHRDLASSVFWESR